MKIEGPHRKGCYALAHTQTKFWGNPWAFVPYDNEQFPNAYGERFRGDKSGRHKGQRQMMGETWFRIVCNDPDCKAKLLVSENEILTLLHENLK